MEETYYAEKEISNFYCTTESTVQKCITLLMRNFEHGDEKRRYICRDNKFYWPILTVMYVGLYLGAVLGEEEWKFTKREWE